MKIKYLFPFVIFVLFTACSSDPCEGVNCVNGNCVEGTCQCEDGFTGNLCDELPCTNGTFANGKCQCDNGFYGELCDISEIEGYYFITKLMHTDCPSYAKQYDLTAPASEGRVCGTNHTDIGICFGNGISLSDDGTMFWIRSIVLETSPDEFETTWLEFENGTYTAQNELITINLENGTTRFVTIGENLLTWERNTSDGGTDCIWKEEYMRR